MGCAPSQSARRPTSRSRSCQPSSGTIDAKWLAASWPTFDDVVHAPYGKKISHSLIPPGYIASIPGAGWEPFEANMRRVLPGVRFFDMEATHPIFHSFFEINALDNFPQAYNAGDPVFRGVFEDNDPGKRLLAIVNYNTDISQYWEWSGRGLRPFDETNEAYKLGVNYVIYGLTH